MERQGPEHPVNERKKRDGKQCICTRNENQKSSKCNKFYDNSTVYDRMDIFHFLSILIHIFCLSIIFTQKIERK